MTLIHENGYTKCQPHAHRGNSGRRAAFVTPQRPLICPYCDNSWSTSHGIPPHCAGTLLQRFHNPGHTCGAHQWHLCMKYIAPPTNLLRHGRDIGMDQNGCKMFHAHTLTHAPGTQRPPKQEPNKLLPDLLDAYRCNTCHTSWHRQSSFKVFAFQNTVAQSDMGAAVSAYGCFKEELPRSSAGVYKFHLECCK